MLGNPIPSGPLSLPPPDARGPPALPRPWRSLLVVAGCGLIVGLLLGLDLTGSYAHGIWLLSAGLVLGMASALAARSYPVLAALGGGVLAVITSVALVVSQQYRSGYWPITDEVAIVQYGTTEMATMRLAVLLLFLVCVPCVGAAAMIAFVKRRAA